MIWIEDSLNNLLKSQIHGFFSEKVKVELGVICLSKFRSSEGWFFECVLLTSGGRKTIHIPVWENKQVWQSFKVMIRKVWSFNPPSEYSRQRAFVCIEKMVISHSRSYAEVVCPRTYFGKNTIQKNTRKNRSDFNTNSFRVRKEIGMLNINFDSILVVSTPATEIELSTCNKGSLEFGPWLSKLSPNRRVLFNYGRRSSSSKVNSSFSITSPIRAKSIVSKVFGK